MEEEDVSSISPFAACAKVDNVAASTTSAAAVLINSPFATCFPMPTVPMSEALSSSFRNIITGGGGGCVGGLARSVGAGTANVFGKFSSLTPPPVAVDSLTATWLPADGIIIRAVVAAAEEEAEEAGPSWASDEFSEL